MKETYKQLDSATAKNISAELRQQSDEVLSFISELDKRLTNTNFLTNGGGAVSVLTFIGTGISSSPLSNYALMCFVLGIIATGIELRALLIFWGKLHKDSSRRLNGWLNNELSVEECHIPKNLASIYTTINDVAGWASQLFFILGVLIGVFAIF